MASLFPSLLGFGGGHAAGLVASQALVVAALLPGLLDFGGGRAAGLVLRSLIPLVSIDQTIPIQNLPVANILQWHHGQSLFLLVPNFLHDIGHAVEEATVHLQSKIVILVQTAAVLRFNKPKIGRENRSGSVKRDVRNLPGRLRVTP